MTAWRTHVQRTRAARLSASLVDDENGRSRMENAARGLTRRTDKQDRATSRHYGHNLAILFFTCLHAVLHSQLKALRSSPYNIWNIKYYDVITALWGHFKGDITIFSVVGVFCTDLEGSFTLLCSQPGDKGDRKHEKKGIIGTRNKTNAAKWIKNTWNRTAYTCFLLNSQMLQITGEWMWFCSSGTHFQLK